MRDTTPPNLMLILVDCLGSRTVFSGKPLPTGSGIGSLLLRGTSFENTVSTATITSPSVATMFTGELPMTHGIRSLESETLGPEIATLPEILARRGYLTHAEVTGPLLPQIGFARGFDVFNHRPARQTVYTEYWDALQSRIADLPTDRPWFLFLHLWELHRPRYMTSRFNDSAFGTDLYERAFACLDQTRLPKLLELAGQESVIILTGDHGEIPRWDRTVELSRKLKVIPLKRFLDRRSAHGHHVYDDLALVPTLLAGPGVPTGRRISANVRTFDLLPTILELAGIEENKRTQGPGRSLIDMFDEHKEDRPGYTEAFGPKLRGPGEYLVSVRHGGFKYVQTADGSKSWLWRLPDEVRDLTAQYPEVASNLIARLDEFRDGADLGSRGIELSASERAEVERHLQELGYLD
jgi:arylsulfatase A-like enzyme